MLQTIPFLCASNICCAAPEGVSGGEVRKENNHRHGPKHGHNHGGLLKSTRASQASACLT